MARAVKACLMIEVLLGRVVIVIVEPWDLSASNSPTAALASGGLMYFGDGGLWTWIGLVIFLICLAAFTALVLRGIKPNSDRRQPIADNTISKNSNGPVMITGPERSN